MLNREPMGMKLKAAFVVPPPGEVSVLNREPMGMKRTTPRSSLTRMRKVSVLNREPMGMKRCARTC